jgi:LPXTG-motif cell wall-anchored protein
MILRLALTSSTLTSGVRAGDGEITVCATANVIQPTTPVPTTNTPVLLGIGVLLALASLYRLRRRRS